MRIVITGASGFIGQKLCRKLLKNRHEVVALCRTRIDYIQSNSYQFIPYVMGQPIPKEAVDFSPEIIIHLAWDGIPDFSEQKCVDNLHSQINFFEQLKNFRGLKKIIGAGTCREYGAKQDLCIENDRTMPDNFFSWAKQSLSVYLKILCQQQQVELVWFRIFYVYGEGQRPEALIPTIIRAHRSNKIPEIKNPFAANDYVYIEDVVNAFIVAIENVGCVGTFNLGSGSAISVAKVAKLVEQLIQEDDSTLDHNSLKAFDIQSDDGMRADITLSSSILGWSPRISLPEGIFRTIRAEL
jgi:dTDP-6-deoxy-L-talose 4-dehydrogenase (NAD+)